MKKFVRTRAPPAPVQLHAHYGAGLGLDDKRSTLTRWGAEGAESQAVALWEDEEFPAAATSLGDRRLSARVLWRRPHEICPKPRFLGDESLEAPPQDQQPELADERAATRWDADASVYGDAALAAAAAALSLTPRLLARAVPPHSFRVGYSGRFMFRFWVFGEWREVSVDDRLPTRPGRVASDDFTLALLEKAYAKLHGSYAALRGGDGGGGAGGLARALQALSGGVLQSFCPPRQPRALLLRVLHAALPRATLLVATARPAYCVTGLARVRDAAEGDEGALVRLRAAARAPQPARNGAWRGLSQSDRELLECRAEPGAFWMSFGDFVRSFARLELVHVGPDDWVREPSLRTRRPWRAVLARRRWRRGYSAGGPPRCPTAHANPQFRLQNKNKALTKEETKGLLSLIEGSKIINNKKTNATTNKMKVDEWARIADSFNATMGIYHRTPQQLRLKWENLKKNSRKRSTAKRMERIKVPGGVSVHAVVSLTQRYSPGAAGRLRAVGFAVYELPAAAPRRAALANDALRDLRVLDVTHESRAREVVTFFTLPPGQYLVVPYVSRPHVEGAFLLRILTDDLTDVWEVNDDNAIVRDIAAEFKDEAFPMPERMRRAIEKLRHVDRTEEVDASELRALLRRAWRALLPAPPSHELCRALVALRDPAVSGRLPLRELPPLLALLAFWKAAMSRAARAGCGRLSAYGLRALLWACGVSASNKVLECVVLRHARGHQLAPLDATLALARLHLAHERYRSLDAKMKSNPLSLEEMILMTIYS